jgi:nitrate reductase gamma subunit
MRYTVFGVLPYLAVGIFIWGLAGKVRLWRRTPTPYGIPLTPAFRTRSDAFLRLAGDAVVFAPLWRRNRWLWVGAVSFHYSLLLVLLRHLRYFFYPAPKWFIYLQGPGITAGYVMTAALLFLLFRRLILRPLILTTTLADIFALLLLLSVCLTGLSMTLFPTDLIAAKTMILGLVRFSPRIPDHSGLLLVHFLLVQVLIMYIPFSKLLHGVGLFFSPTLIQPDDVLRRRRINPWDLPDPDDARPESGPAPGAGSNNRAAAPGPGAGE